MTVLILEFLVSQQWVAALTSFYVVLVLALNLLAYNFSGIYLIRILRNHQKTGTGASGEDVSGSKSASPFDIVISRTFKSMALLTVPSTATLVLFLIIGVSNSNTRPSPVFNPQAVAWNLLATFSVQLILGLVFTRVAWITKAALEAQIPDCRENVNAIHGERV